MSLLIDFIEHNKNWYEILTQPPYSITIKQQGDLYLFKYSANTDFSHPLSCECRGIILEITDKVRVVASALKKFFNYGEEYADEIDFSRARITEKIDGSNIRLYYYGGRWRVATLSCIDMNETLLECGKNFQDLTEEALGYPIRDYGILHHLDKDYTYIYELTTPYNVVVISYNKSALWTISRINNKTGKEEFISPTPHTNKIKSFSFSSIDEILAAAKILPNTQEGFVVYEEGTGKRIKVKSPEYFAAHRLVNNGRIPSISDVLKMETANILDDYLGLYPKYADHVRKILRAKQDYFTSLSESLKNARKLFALQHKDEPNFDYLMSCFSLTMTPEDYWEKISLKNKEKIIGGLLS